jgi:hypothetical protein
MSISGSLHFGQLKVIIAQDIIHYKFIPGGHTINKKMYVEIIHGCNEKEISRKMGMKQLVSSVQHCIYTLIVGCKKVHCQTTFFCFHD